MLNHRRITIEFSQILSLSRWLVEWGFKFEIFQWRFKLPLDLFWAFKLHCYPFKICRVFIFIIVESVRPEDSLWELEWVVSEYKVAYTPYKWFTYEIWHSKRIKSSAVQTFWILYESFIRNLFQNMKWLAYKYQNLPVAWSPEDE